MRKEIIIDKTPNAEDILPCFVGYEKCEKSHSFGPAIRTVYLIHYCLSGNGILYNKYGEHKVSAGELFVIRPGEITTYTADESDPWHYVWIGFSGKLAKIFSDNKSVYPCSDAIFHRILNLIETEEKSYNIYTALIHELIYELFSDFKQKQDTPSKIHSYINYNYMQNISVKSICNMFGYERTNLYRIFKKRYGMSIKDYMMKVRMEHAQSFLLQGNSVCNVAVMTGYNDEFNFSKAYKKYYGYAPSYTRSFKQNQNLKSN